MLEKVPSYRPDKMTGSKYEETYLGSVDSNSLEYKKALGEISRPSKNSKMDFYYNFNDSLELAKKFQPVVRRDKEGVVRADPTNPDKPFLNDLRIELLEILNLPEDKEDDVKIYTAVGTPLDILHGVDAFIEIDGQIVTFDLTLKKDKYFKADVLIAGELPDPRVEEDDYLERIIDEAVKINKVLMRRENEKAEAV